jgi:outer membrane protein
VIILPQIKPVLMKHFSTILNVILLIAVAFLYFHEFGGAKAKNKTSKAVAVANHSSVSGIAPIAYVELDSLNEKITMIKEKRKELEAEQRAIETEWESGYRGLENQRNNFLKKGNAITQQMAEEFQGKLREQQQKIDAKKQGQTQKLTEKSYKSMDEIQSKLKKFLAEYNKDKKYLYILTTGTGQEYMVYKDSSLNVTNDVIAGMNEKLTKGN